MLSVCQHCGQVKLSLVEWHGWRVDFARNVAIRGDIEVQLQGREAELFHVILEVGGRPITKGYIEDRVWGHLDDVPLSNSINVMVTKLYKKFKEYGFSWSVRRGVVITKYVEQDDEITCEVQLLAGVVRVRRGPYKFGTEYFLSVPFTFDGDIATAQALASPLFTARIGLAIGHKLKRDFGGVRWQRRDHETGEITKTSDFRRKQPS